MEVNHGARGLRTGLAHDELGLDPMKCGVGLCTMQRSKDGKSL